MKKFILSEMMLISHTERKAKKVQFSQDRTLIFGKNGTGKSCLMKSIYKTFGATPNEHPSWKKINPISFVRFSVGGVNYSILKDAVYYSVFDGKDNVIGVFRSVTNELAPFLAELFDFKVKLPDKKGNLIIPPPAFLFLPYYIDQDLSWSNNWSSFQYLQQVKGYREAIVPYHTGIRPNEYYEAKGKVEEYSTVIETLDSERKALRNVLNKVQGSLSQTDFNIDIDSFKEEIKELLVECEILKGNQERLKAKLVDLYNTKINVESQIAITKHALKESKLDYKLANEIMVDSHVDCPTCGAQYENSFLERFEIAKDEDRCKDLLAELTEELNKVSSSIEKENTLFNRNNVEIVRIESILDKKKGEIKLKDLIESAGKAELKTAFSENSRYINQEIAEKALLKSDLEKRLKGLTDKNRRETIMKSYFDYMHLYLNKVDVKTLSQKDYSRIDAKIKETGSALPRALVAYYFSIFQVIRLYGSSAYCPLIIDSPNQQAQDPTHLKIILEFINENQPKDSQMILGLEDLNGVDFDCKVIELNDEKSLLQANEYDAVNDELDVFQTKILNHGFGNRLF